MGHTVSSQRQVIDRLTDELERYGEVLDEEEKELFVRLLKQPYEYVGSMSHASSLHTWAFLTLSVCLEQEKEIEALKERMEQYKTKSELE